MRILNFNIKRQKIKKDPDCDFNGIVAGTKGYLHAQFSFSEEWDGCKKVACFTRNGKEYYAPLVNGRCEIPEEALGFRIFLVSVIGERDGYRIRTDKVEVRQNG